MWRRALRENRRAILAFVFWAFATMAAFSASYGLGYLAHIPLSGLPVWFAVTVSYGIAVGAGIVLANAILWAVVLFLRERLHRPLTPGLVVQLAASAIGSSAGNVVAELGRGALTHRPPELSPLGPALVGGCWLGVIFFLLRLAVGYAARYRRIKQATKLAQGQVLANQLKPHFLFNALNSLSELIETDAPRGAEMAQRLSDLFRRIASGAEHATMPLATELAIVREYLEIERVRMGARLRYDIDEPTWSAERYVPTLMVQTLVENAIKHGIAPSIEGGTVKVAFHTRDDGAYECVVVNTGMPFKPSSGSSGMGLANTRDRLRQLYGDDCTLTLEGDATGTRASFWFSGAALAQHLAR